MKGHTNTWVAASLALAILCAAPVAASGQDLSDDDIMGIMRQSSAIIEGQVISVAIEVDRRNDSIEVSVLDVSTLITGNLESERITIRQRIYGISDTRFGYLPLKLDENLILCLGGSGPSRNPLIKFTLIGDLVKGSTITVEEFKQKISNIVELGIDETDLPPAGDS